MYSRCTLKYRIIGEFGIIVGGRGGGLETLSKINNGGGWNNGGDKKNDAKTFLVSI